MEGLIVRGLQGGWPASSCRRPSRASRTTSRSRATAATSRTCASAWNSVDVSDRGPQRLPGVSASALKQGGRVKGINVKGKGGMTRRETRRADGVGGAVGRQGPGVDRGGSGRRRSPIAKFLSEDELSAVLEAAGAAPGDLLLFVGGQRGSPRRSWAGCGCSWGGKFSRRPARVRPVWIVDFRCSTGTPRGKLGAAHHPFTAPRGRGLDLLETDPATCRPRRTTWSSTATSAAAAASVSTAGTCRRRVRRAGHLREEARETSSASCWTRLNTARRRTAASPSADR